MYKDKHRRLYRYQEIIANHLADTGRSCILSLEMRMGKTVIAFAICNKKPMKTLIVCPASLIHVWQKHIEDWCDRPDLISIVSYSKMSRAEYINKVKAGTFHRLIADEAHKTRHTNSISNKAIRILCQKKQWKQKLFLTATPIINEPSDMYLMLRNCMDKPFNKAEFLNKFYNFEYNYFAKQHLPTTFKKPKTFKKLCQKYMIRVTYDGLNIDRGFNRYKEVLTFKVPQDDEQVNKVLIETPKLGASKLHICEPVLQALVNAKDKAIIFFSYLETGKQLGEAMDCQVVSGKTTKKERLRIIEDFKNNKVPCIALSINVFSEGIDLSFCNKLIIFENTWSGFSDLQAIARCDSIKREFNQYIYYIMSKNELKYAISKRKLKYETLLTWETDIETLKTRS